MISSKNKNRVVLPSRPEPPSMDQILQDIQSAAPDDPVFSILDQKGRGEEEELPQGLINIDTDLHQVPNVLTCSGSVLRTGPTP